MRESDNKNIPQEYLFADMQLKNNDIKAKRSVFLYIGIVLLNICMLAVCWVVLGNKYGVASFDSIFDVLDWKYLLFLCLLFLLIWLLQVMRDYISIFKRVKRKRFWGVVFANQKYNFYSNIASLGGCKIPYTVRLNNSNIDRRTAVDTLYGKKFSQLLAKIVYSSVCFVLGVIFCMKSANIWMVILGVVAFLINGAFLCFLIYSVQNMEKSIVLVAKFSKLLYKLKLIKDYESFYKKTTNVLCEYSLVIKGMTKFSVISILSDMLIIFLRHFGLFVIFQMLNFGGCQYFVEILFSCTILDLIVSILPLPKGTLLYELLFSVLFINVFFEGYLGIGVILYRAFDYFLYILIPGIILLFDKKKVLKETENIIE